MATNRINISYPRPRSSRYADDGAGPPGLVYAAGVVGLFNALDRVADATGVPLAPEKAAASADFRAALDLDRLLGCRQELTSPNLHERFECAREQLGAARIGDDARVRGRTSGGC